jgi:hypothetical protein
MDKKKRKLFSRIETIDDAKAISVDAAKGFYFVAVLQGAIGYFLAPAMIIDAILYAVLAFILHKFTSRTAAVFLLILSSFSFYVTLMNKIGQTHEGGNNIILAIIMVGIGIEGVRSTFKYHAFKKAGMVLNG